MRVPNTVEKLLLAAPRGYCAGVDRAVQTVERALEIHGAPVYVRKEIVHNKHVVETAARARRDLRRGADRGARGRGLRVLRARRRAERPRRRRRARLQTIDATCPLVTKVHREAVRFAEEGYTIVLVGHDGHEEVEGTMGEAPERIVLVQSEQDVDELEVEDPRAHRLHHPDDARGRRNDARSSRVCASASRASSGPRTDDICYATTNRQAAVKQMAGSCDLMLVIGSRNSSNSVRLVEVARDCGTEAYLIDNARRGARGVARRAGAWSASPRARARRRTWCAELVDFFRARGVSDISEFDVVREDVRFMLPKPIREAVSAGEAS